MTKTCRQCESLFVPVRPLQAVCSATCAGRKVRADAKARKAAERAQTRARREAIKTIPQRKREAQTAFNAFVRARDIGQDCISCGIPSPTWEYHGGWDCGHYRSTGSADHMRYDERNAHLQCVWCNQHRAGNVVSYRRGLILRIGLEAVEALEINDQSHKWSHDELIDIKARYKAKRKEMEKAHG